MITHNLLQSSPDWHEFRSTHYGASETAAMLGISPHMSRTELLQLKATGISKDHSDYTKKIFQNGHETEAAARLLLEEDMQEDFYPVTCSKDNLSASVDGLTMDGSTAFEHKLLNNGLFENVLSQQVPDHYMSQCQQILMVTGAERVIFMCSDGTREKRASVEVIKDQSWFDRIEAGWVQFSVDLANYQHKEISEKPEPSAIMQLPTLSIQIKGEVVSSNLPMVREKVDVFLSQIKTDLSTDEDFVNAEATIKFCSKLESALKAAKSHAIGQTVSIDVLMKEIDFMEESVRQNRLTQEKLVKSQKDKIKEEIIDDACMLCEKHVDGIHDELIKFINFGNHAHPAIWSRRNFETACKNKRTLASLHNAVDTEVAAIKIKLDELARVIRKNLTHLPEDLSLFRDLQSIITKPEDDFKLLVESRLAEQKRKEEEAAQRAIAEVKAAEERGKAQAAAAQERESLSRENEEKRIQEAKEAEARRIEQEAQVKAELEARLAELKRKEEAARAADESHRKMVITDIEESLMRITSLDARQAEEICAALLAGKIKNVTINF